jgi:hypothetical protein
MTIGRWTETGDGRKTEGRLKGDAHVGDVGAGDLSHLSAGVLYTSSRQYNTYRRWEPPGDSITALADKRDRIVREVLSLPCNRAKDCEDGIEGVHFVFANLFDAYKDQGMSLVEIYKDVRQVEA